jgi:TPR repeat protein
MDKLEEIKNYLQDKGYNYIKIPEESTDEIYQLYINNVEKKVKNDIEYLYFGMYYQINKNYDKMKKYYLMAIKKGNSLAMNNLGLYYKEIENNYELAKKYYLMAIENGNIKVISSVICYYNYKYREQNKDLIKTYLLMAVKKANNCKNTTDLYIYAIHSLGKWYQEVEHNDKLAEYYYLMAINNKFSLKIGYRTYSNLAHLYYKQNKNYDKIFEYIIESIKLNFTYNLINIKNDLDLLFKLFEINIKYKNNINKDIINDIYNKYYYLLSNENKTTLYSLIDRTDQMYCMF